MSDTGAHPGRALDLRLVPAAGLVWASCAWAIGADQVAVWALVLTLLLVAAVALRWLRHRARARHRHWGADLLTTAVLAMLVAAAALSTLALRGGARAATVAELEGSTAVVTVRLQREPGPHTRGALADALLLAVDGHPGELRAPVVVLGGEDWLGLQFGALVRTRARLVATDAGDDRTFLLIAESVESVQPPVEWRARVANIRAGLAELCRDLPPASRGLVPGIALGDDRLLPDTLEEDMRAVSLTHLTAISGAHVAMLLAVLMVALLWLPRWARAVVGGVAMLAFVALVRPEGSVLRAAVMGAVMLLGLALRRPRTGLPALAAAVIVLIAADPWIARSFGFALSVLATLGLLLLAPAMMRPLARVLPTPLAAAVAIPLAAQLACLPVLALLQPALPVYGVLANVLAAPVVPAATVLGVLAALLAPAAPGPAEVLVHAASWCAEWIATVARFCAQLPAAGVAWPIGVAVLAGLAVTIWLLRAGGRRERTGPL